MHLKKAKCTFLLRRYQEYVPVHVTSDVHPVPDDFDLAVGALAACSGLTSYNAITSIRETVEENLRVRGQSSHYI